MDNNSAFVKKDTFVNSQVFFKDLALMYYHLRIETD